MKQRKWSKEEKMAIVFKKCPQKWGAVQPYLSRTYLTVDGLTSIPSYRNNSEF
jgi:hypothetical protein